MENLFMKIQIIKDKNINNYLEWPIWTCKESQFDWEYSDEEHCYVITGEVEVKVGKELIKIQSGDYVIFPKGLKCFWNVLSPVKKYYSFK